MLNSVCLVGRFTDTPELRTTTGGLKVTSFTLAVGRSFVKQGGERQTDFIDLVAWRETADFICRYFKKGQLVSIKGAIQTRNYTDKEGKNRKAVEVLVDGVDFVESKSSADARTTSAAPAPAAAVEAPVAYTAGEDSDFAVIEGDEDLPF